MNVTLPPAQTSIVTKRGYHYEGLTTYDRGCLVVERNDTTVVVPLSSVDHYVVAEASA